MPRFGSVVTTFMVVIMLVMVMMVPWSCMMAVVCAAFRRSFGQLAVEIRGGERFHRGARSAGANFDALLREQMPRRAGRCRPQ